MPTLPAPPPQTLGHAPFVLAVEDSHHNLKLLSTLLSRLYIPHQTALNGAAAVSAYTAHTSTTPPLPGSVRLILMDVSMPVLDGLQATAQIRAFETARGLPRVRIVLMKAGGFEKGLLRTGADGVLGKPVRIGELRGAVGELVDREEERGGGAAGRLAMVRGHVGGDGGGGGLGV